MNYAKIDGAGCIICQSNEIYSVENIVKKNKKRLIPSLTANSIRERNQDGDMIEEPVDSEVSLGGEYEFNGNNFEFTFNPDFLKLKQIKAKLI